MRKRGDFKATLCKKKLDMHNCASQMVRTRNDVA